jgi:hypothetical protein
VLEPKGIATADVVAVNEESELRPFPVTVITRLEMISERDILFLL